MYTETFLLEDCEREQIDARVIFYSIIFVYFLYIEYILVVHIPCVSAELFLLFLIAALI